MAQKAISAGHVRNIICVPNVGLNMQLQITARIKTRRTTGTFMESREQRRVRAGNMKIEFLRHPTEQDWIRCKALALNTIGKKAITLPSDEWKKKILQAEHSPIRTLMFTIRMEIPYYVSVHFVRHKYGVEHYVTSQRNDRQDAYDRNAARQDAPVVHIMDINAQALMTMARRRLCGQADPATREVMEEIRAAVVERCPEFETVLVPMCEYRGICPEFVSCGKIQNSSVKGWLVTAG